MNEDVERCMERSREDLKAAQLLTTAGYESQAISRAYYAVFYAAEAALLQIGETRSKHSGVISAFGNLIVKQRGFNKEVARLLRDLFEERNEADYSVLLPFTSLDAESAVSKAERFVAAVEAWVSKAPEPESP